MEGAWRKDRDSFRGGFLSVPASEGAMPGLAPFVKPFVKPVSMLAVGPAMPQMLVRRLCIAHVLLVAEIPGQGQVLG